ncbi:uncharacterized protein CLUP02_00887 [Colletotrichum lupini]|uniref:Uncharacterized protein n=1 Tax=Colletotrichum lupini TaxID=145971 RepID=A0A9Q8SBB2_9PEZI|nr:uncharacterized protein CLUP02_00887 [Colletotrichum lupini]UQC74239.1 hypothetical protein CLUP02_00887 [Colletotrichum lupini]
MRAGLVVGSVTTSEYLVLYVLFCIFASLISGPVGRSSPVQWKCCLGGWLERRGAVNTEHDVKISMGLFLPSNTGGSSSPRSIAVDIPQQLGRLPWLSGNRFSTGTRGGSYILSWTGSVSLQSWRYG